MKVSARCAFRVKTFPSRLSPVKSIGAQTYKIDADRCKIRNLERNIVTGENGGKEIKITGAPIEKAERFVYTLVILAQFITRLKRKREGKEDWSGDSSSR